MKLGPSGRHVSWVVIAVKVFKVRGQGQGQCTFATETSFRRCDAEAITLEDEEQVRLTSRHTGLATQRRVPGYTND